MARPEGARIVRANGEVIPCELAPLGLDDEGYDVWAVATMLQAGDRLTVESFPPKTGIVGPISDRAMQAVTDSGELPFAVTVIPPSRTQRLILGRRFNRFMLVVCAVILAADLFNANYHVGLLGGDWHPLLAALNLAGAAVMAWWSLVFWRRGR